jgi:membrane-anchored glycerophosphoryl diester phosphodiesterase (GDPDase)
MQFDMNRTWSQAVALVRANFQLLAVIAGVFLLLPTLALYLLNPDLMQFMALSADPTKAEAAMNAMLPRLLGYGLIVIALQLVGQMAMVAMMGSSRPTVGESLKLGAKALPSVIGAAIVFIVGFLAAGLALGLVLGLLIALFAAIFGTAVGTSLAAMGLIVGLLYIAIFVLELYVMVRFMMTLPIIVLDQQYNPIKALRRSWRMTGPRAWAILGFIVLLGVAYFVILMVLMIAIGALGFVSGGELAAGQASTGSVVALSLVISVGGALVAMLASGILVSMHQQLAGGAEPHDVEFDA